MKRKEQNAFQTITDTPGKTISGHTKAGEKLVDQLKDAVRCINLGHHQ